MELEEFAAAVLFKFLKGAVDLVEDEYRFLHFEIEPIFVIEHFLLLVGDLLGILNQGIVLGLANLVHLYIVIGNV